MTLPSPYPGLRPFQPEEAHLFFGREVQVEDMLARLEDHWFLAVVGTSGCGKSSLVRAGLIPALEQGFLSDAKPNWRIAVMSPGSAPFDNLTTALLREAALGHERRSASQQAASLLQATLRRGPLGLVEAVAESHLPEDTNLLLVVDQFEEIFRYRKQTQNVNDADAFVNLLLASAQSQQSEVPMYVVITMRSDFIGDCALFTGLPEAINDSQFLTPRLTRDQYRSAIVEPALVAGGQLDDALVNQLLNDLRGEPDQLPVLQHALMRMWTLVGDNVLKRALTLDDYKEVGGLAGALSKHCDEILNELNPEQQRIAEVMFRALCERSSEQRDTRHPAQLGEVAAIAGVDVEAVVPVVDAFRDTGRNFLMPPLPIALDAERTLDISHESLIRQWQTLNTWVEAEAESARQYQRLEDAAKRRQQRAGAELWRGVDLENARVWKEHEKPTETWAARYGDAYQLAMDFLEASEAEEEKQRHEHERAHQRELEQAREFAEMQSARAEEQATRAAEQARAASRLRAITMVIGVLLLVTISVAIYAFSQRNSAASAQQRAEEAQQDAQEKEKQAISAAVEAKRQQGIADQQRQVALVRLAHYFSAESKASIEAQPTLSILLGMEAIKLSMEASKTALIPTGEEALRNAIANIAGTALVGHADAVNGVVFSPNGQMLATASEDTTVRLWALNNPTAEPRVLRGHTDMVFGVAFSPNGQVLATASKDTTVRLWALNNPTAEPRVLRGHTDMVFGVAFSPNGQVLATASKDTTVRLWALNNPTAEPRVLGGHAGVVIGVAFSPNGQMLATASKDKTVRLWALNNPTAEPRVLRGHTDTVNGVAFSPNGQMLATASEDTTVRLWALNNPTAEPRVLGGHTDKVIGVAFSPNGQVLATASSDKTVRLWALNNPTAEPRVLRGHAGVVIGVAFSPNGQVLATASEDKTVRLWALNNPTAEPRVLRGHTDMVIGVAFSPDGQVLATASKDKTVRLWALNNPTAEPRVLRGHTDTVNGVVFSPNGQVLATASEDETVRLWALNNPTAEPRVLRGHAGVVNGVAFSPDGQVLATVSSDKTVRLWALNNPTAEPRVLRGHADAVFGVAFSPDGQVLATVSSDTTVRLWALNNPTAEPRVLRGHTDMVFGVAFSPDGQVLATASSDTTVRLWSVAIDNVVRIACLLVSGNFSYKDWQRYLSDEPYRKTCQNHPLHPSFLEIIRGQVMDGDVDGAVTTLRKALRVDDISDVVLQQEAQRLVAPWLVEKGRKLARERDVDGASGVFKQALVLDPNLTLDPEKEARQLATLGLLDKGQELAKQGAIREAMAAFEEAQASDPTLEIAAVAWNSLCWFGSLGDFATDVMIACERAVALEPDRGQIRNSRGLARALTGDYPGAIKDFQRFLEWGPKNGIPKEQIRQRQDWIRMLQANQNPFNKELLKLLRDQ